MKPVAHTLPYTRFDHENSFISVGKTTEAVKTMPRSELMSANLAICDSENGLGNAFILILYQLQFFCKVFEM